MSQNPYSENPYAPTQAPGTPLGPQSMGFGGGNLIPTNGLATTIKICLGLFIASYATSSLLETYGGLTFETYFDPNAPLTSEVEQALVLLVGGLALLNLPLMIVTAICVCMFMYRCNANLRAYGLKSLEYTPGWCAGWWFVPLLNLWRPYYCMKEIFVASRDPKRWLRAADGEAEIVKMWWALWIIGGIVSNIQSRLALRGINIGIGNLGLSWATSLLLGGAALTLIMVVSRINDWQDRLINSPRTA